MSLNATKLKLSDAKSIYYVQVIDMDIGVISTSSYLSSSWVYLGT